jgi:hypothetical protein
MHWAAEVHLVVVQVMAAMEVLALAVVLEFLLLLLEAQALFDKEILAELGNMPLMAMVVAAEQELLDLMDIQDLVVMEALGLPLQFLEQLQHMLGVEAVVLPMVLIVAFLDWVALVEAVLVVVNLAHLATPMAHPEQ